MTNNYTNWLSWITTKKITNDASNLRKEAVGNHLQDISRPTLEQLQQQGYTTVTWDATNSRHSICRELHNQQWLLSDFLSGLAHDAPIFEKSHPGDTNCRIVVSGDDLQSISVDCFGNASPL